MWIQGYLRLLAANEMGRKSAKNEELNMLPILTNRLNLPIFAKNQLLLDIKAGGYCYCSNK